MMDFFTKLRFKIPRLFFLIVFIGIATVYLYNFSLNPSKSWHNSFILQFWSYLASTVNYTLIKDLFLNKNLTAGKLISTNSIMTTSQVPTTVSFSTAPPYHNSYPRQYHFVLNEPDICEKQNPFLVLMVPVAPQEMEARKAIRVTWGKERVVQGKNVIVLFLLGLRTEVEDSKQQELLKLESQEYQDLIQSNFKDSYLNLTLKTMVIMDWLATHCPKATYAMKIDSDMFLNVENLMKMLLAPDLPKENYITGMVMWNRPVVRNQNSKWYVPHEAYPEDVYPTYLLGMGYVFSNDLPEKLISVSKDIQPFYIEDAYVGVCLKKLGLSPSNPPDPSQFKAYFHGEYNREEFARVITTILGSPHQLVTFWQDLKKPT